MVNSKINQCSTPNIVKPHIFYHRNAKFCISTQGLKAKSTHGYFQITERHQCMMSREAFGDSVVIYFYIVPLLTPSASSI